MWYKDEQNLSSYLIKDLHAHTDNFLNKLYTTKSCHIPKTKKTSHYCSSQPLPVSAKVSAGLNLVYVSYQVSRKRKIYEQKIFVS